MTCRNPNLYLDVSIYTITMPPEHIILVEEVEEVHEMTDETLAWIRTLGTEEYIYVPPADLNTTITLRELVYGPNHVYEQ